MAENLSPETSEKLRYLCRKIAVAHTIDEEIQQELYSHMEDKFLGYLSGEEKITEEDAFILVREHFGKPESIKDLLQEVHSLETRISLARKIGAVLAATLGIGALSYTVEIILRFVGFWVFGPSIDRWTLIFQFYLLGIIFLPFILYRWREAQGRGESIWYKTASLYTFLLILLILLCFDTIVPIILFFSQYRLFNILPWYYDDFLRGHVAFSTGYHTDIHMNFSFLTNQFTDFGFRISGLLSFGYLIAQCGIWLWWCDSTSRRILSRVIVVVAWLLFTFLIANYTPQLGFGSNMGSVRTIIYWHRYPYDISAIIFHYLIIGTLVAAFYSLTKYSVKTIKRILERRRKTGVVAIQQ
jgi:hypothetical protein